MSTNIKSSITKAADEIERDLWRLRSVLGLPPSAKEKAFVEFLKSSPEFRQALREKADLQHPSGRSYRPPYRTKVDLFNLG